MSNVPDFYRVRRCNHLTHGTTRVFDFLRERLFNTTPFYLSTTELKPHYHRIRFIRSLNSVLTSTLYSEPANIPPYGSIRLIANCIPKQITVNMDILFCPYTEQILIADLVCVLQYTRSSKATRTQPKILKASKKSRPVSSIPKKFFYILLLNQYIPLMKYFSFYFLISKPRI